MRDLSTQESSCGSAKGNFGDENPNGGILSTVKSCIPKRRAEPDTSGSERGSPYPTSELRSRGVHRGKLGRYTPNPGACVHDQLPGRRLLLRIVGGGPRKLRRRFAAAESRTSTNFCRASTSRKSKTTSEKTKLNGRTLCISRSVSKSGTRESTPEMSLFSRTTTTSENDGDVMVEKTSTRASRASPLRPKGTVRTLKCRDRRTSRRDRSKLESDD